MIAGQREKFRRDVAAALPVRYDVRERRHIVVQKGPHLKELLLALLADDAVDIAGVWFPKETDGVLQISDRKLPILWTDDVPSLYQEGRIDVILLDETDDKGAAALQAAGVPSSILC